MSKMIASEDLRAAHARLEQDGRLGEHLFLLGMRLDEIKAKRNKRATRYHRPTYDPNEAALDRFPRSDRPDAPMPVETADYLSAGLGRGLETIRCIAVEQREASARLRSQGAPLAGKTEQWLPHVPGRPTDERFGKQGGAEAFEEKTAGAGEVTPLKRYRVKGHLEPHEEKFPIHIADAFRNFRDDAEAAGITHVTANYDGFSGGARGPKTGGLGAATLDVRAAYWRHQFRMEMLRALDHDGDRTTVEMILNWILLQAADKPGAHIPSMADIGRKIVPWFTHEATAKGVAWGWVEFAGRFLAAVDHAMDSRALRMNGGAGVKTLAAARGQSRADLKAIRQHAREAK